METSNYIPSGRTSLVKKDDLSLQVQTEYAFRPVPRITTTISREGQVIHKVERALEQPITSIEEQDMAENTIRRQHAEIVNIIKRGSVIPQERPVPADEPTILQEAATMPDQTAEHEPKDELPTTSTFDRLMAIPGTQRIYRLDNEGNFVNDRGSSEFKKAFAMIFKNLRELMRLFDRMPGVGITRQKGVYEVEQDRLYFVSVGLECYFIVVYRVDNETNYERAIKAVISDPY